MIERYNVEIDLTKSFLKHILQKPLYINDLEDIDPEEAKNLIFVLNNNVDELELNFTLDRVIMGSYHSHELIPDGTNVLVNE